MRINFHIFQFSYLIAAFLDSRKSMKFANDSNV